MPAVVAGMALMAVSPLFGPAFWFVGMFSMGLGVGLGRSRR